MMAIAMIRKFNNNHLLLPFLVAWHVIADGCGAGTTAAAAACSDGGSSGC